MEDQFQMDYASIRDKKSSSRGEGFFSVGTEFFVASVALTFRGIKYWCLFIWFSDDSKILSFRAGMYNNDLRIHNTEKMNNQIIYFMLFDYMYKSKPRKN